MLFTLIKPPLLLFLEDKKVPFLYINLIEEKQNSRMLSKDLQVALSSKPEALKSVIGGYKQ